MSGTVTPLGDGALRLALPPGVDPREALETLRALPRVLDAVVAEACACVYFDPAHPPDSPWEHLAALRTGGAHREGTVHTVRVRYDGVDLATVAERTGLSEEEVVHLHASTEYRVRAVGFLPGFSYLGDVDARLSVPRLPVPRPRVPAGAVGIAGRRCAIYPFVSPGGWNLLGTAVDFTAFHADTGATLQLGDVVRFERV